LPRDNDEYRLDNPRASEEYLFIWSSSFHEGVEIHVARLPEGVRLTLEVRCFVAPTVVKRYLSAGDWEELQGALAAVDFWGREEWPQQRRFNGSIWVAGLDGATWTIVGRRGDLHRCVAFWSPGAGPIQDLGKLFFRLAGFRSGAGAIY
jgi:hypothetical protein